MTDKCWSKLQQPNQLATPNERFQKCAVNGRKWIEWERDNTNDNNWCVCSISATITHQKALWKTSYFIHALHTFVLHCIVYTIESLKCKIRAIDGAGWRRYNCPVYCLVEYRINGQIQWKLKLTRNLQQPHWLCSVKARVYGAWFGWIPCNACKTWWMKTGLPFMQI